MVLPLHQCFEPTYWNGGKFTSTPSQAAESLYISSIAFPRDKFCVNEKKKKNMISDYILRLGVSLQEQEVILCVALNAKW